MLQAVVQAGAGPDKLEQGSSKGRQDAAAPVSTASGTYQAGRHGVNALQYGRLRQERQQTSRGAIGRAACKVT